MPDLVELLSRALRGVMPLAQTEVAQLEELGIEDESYRLQAARAKQSIADAEIALGALRDYNEARDAGRASIAKALASIAPAAPSASAARFIRSGKTSSVRWLRAMGQGIPGCNQGGARFALSTLEARRGAGHVGVTHADP